MTISNGTVSVLGSEQSINGVPMTIANNGTHQSENHCESSTSNHIKEKNMETKLQEMQIDIRAAKKGEC
jgi:hypothetical protein